MAGLSEFPDRQLLVEDVICCGDDQAAYFPLRFIVILRAGHLQVPKQSKLTTN